MTNNEVRMESGSYPGQNLYVYTDRRGRKNVRSEGNANEQGSNL
jgi:hypothetical protein